MNNPVFIEIPIMKLKWWEKIIFRFLPTRTSISSEGTLKFKMWRGIMYIIDMKLNVPEQNTGFDDVITTKNIDLLNGRERREVN